MINKQIISQLVGLMLYQQKLSGSMPAAGTTTVYYRGVNLSESNANWDHGNDANKTENVGQYSANHMAFWPCMVMCMNGRRMPFRHTHQLGCHGPIVDLCTDRVHRGGSWSRQESFIRSAHRGHNLPRLQIFHHRFPSQFSVHQQTTQVDLNSTAPLTIAENQPAGTIVGEFNATDPEGGAILTN